MKLLVKKARFSGDVEDHLHYLFTVPHMKLLFNERYEFRGELRHTGLKIQTIYMPVDMILERIPPPGNNVYLVLTTVDLKGSCGTVRGKGHDRKAIATNWNGCCGYRLSPGLKPGTTDFYATILEEIGHAAGAGHDHHRFDPKDPCVMTDGMDSRTYEWPSVESIRYCNACLDRIVKNNK